jgi:RNA polymerase sigma-70 factor (ECF subfamily)
VTPTTFAPKTGVVAAAAERDVLAVHAEHAEFVWVTLQRLGVRPADVEDLLQEVFLVVHRRLDTFDASSRMTTWLFGICLRIAAAHRRRAYVRRERTGEGLDDAADANENPEEAAVARQGRARLYAILDMMDLERRALFVMFEIDEVPCIEIARTLGVPLGTVYSRLHAARQEFDAAARRFQAREASRAPSPRGGRP